MGILMIRCPNTGREISTGRKTDQSSFDRSPVFFGHTICPICQTRHEWFAREAWVQEIADSATPRSEGRFTILAARPIPAQCRPSNRAKNRGEGMGLAARTIVLLNIQHFRRLLESETDPTKRKMIENLLAEEQAKLGTRKESEDGG